VTKGITSAVMAGMSVACGSLISGIVVSFGLPCWRGRQRAMHAPSWILVIEIFADWRHPGSRHESSRTRNLTEAACLILAQEVRSERTISYCYRDGEKDSGMFAKPRKPQRPDCVDCRAPPGLGWG
jgi:hypothetical protein